jgi:hypothetical protein
MWRTALVIASLLCLPACAPKWQRADTSPQQLAQDDYECIQETRDPAPMVMPRSGYADGTASGYALGRGIAVRSYYKACMRARGYAEE